MLLKVASKSDPNSVAGAIVGTMKSSGSVEILTIGAGALNQAIKAVAIARGFVAPNGKDLSVKPCFTDIVTNDEQRTGIKLLVEIF